MKSILLVAVLGVVCQAQEKCACQWTTPGLGKDIYLSLYGVASSKLDAQSIRIYQLQRWVERLRKRLDDAVSTGKGSIAKALLTNIERIEDNGCRRGEFQCGGDHPRCLSHLLVCDGDADCLNGADESERICTVVPLPGTIWAGRMHWKACKLRGTEIVRFSIISTKRKNYFKSGDWLTVVVSTEYEENSKTHTQSLLMEGFYFRATTRLVLKPVNDTGDGTKVVCFAERDGVSAFCHMVRMGDFNDLTICASTYVTLQ